MEQNEMRELSSFLKNEGFGADGIALARENGWLIKEWEQNLAILSNWFPDAKFWWSSETAYYELKVSETYGVRLVILVDRKAILEGQEIAAVNWFMDFNRFHPQGDEVNLLSMDIVGSNSDGWVNVMSQHYPEYRSEFDSVAIAMDLMWQEVISPHLSNQGLFVGSWAAGVVLVGDPKLVEISREDEEDEGDDGWDEVRFIW